MMSWKKVLVGTETTLIEAISALDKGALQIALVVDQGRRLLGTITDGDIRRSLLKGRGLDALVDVVMNKNPLTIQYGMPRSEALLLMRSQSVLCLPVVDKNNRVIGLETSERLLLHGDERTSVVLMAGGKGMRLRPLTENIPKPLLKVKGKPVLAHIIERFVEQGFKTFYISINYRGEMIRDHFGDGSNYGAQIYYIEEDKALGTGGALSLLPLEDLSENIVVMNSDLLTTLNFRQLLDFHRKNGGVATMAVRDYSFRVPYGVVQADAERFVAMVEKPAHSYFVNAGIYVLNSNQIKLVPKDEFFDLPSMFDLLNGRSEKLTVFPLREDWLDIGSHQDYALANDEA